MAGLTFDTGALIGLERRRHRMRKVLDAAWQGAVRVTVPTIVLAEWWRGAGGMRELILSSLHVEPMDAVLAKSAGEALAEVRGAAINDAIVMASAARRGDVVYTSDYDDLIRLQRVFRSVRVFTA